MEVRPGYKQTDVGVIPEKWEPTLLRDACAFHNGRAYALHEWERSGIPVIRLQNLTGGEDYYYSTLQLPEQKYCDHGDLLYMWSATFGPRLWLGNRAIYHYHIWKVAPREGRATKEFLFYKLLEITDQKRARATNGGTMLHVTKASMETTSVALPPCPEQRAIAAALSDADALLGGLDRLIAKKRDLKQAAMQQLLTGQTRLPGFSGEWKPRKFSELLKYERPDQYIVRSTEYEKEGDTPVLTANKSFVLGYTNETFGVFDRLPAIIFDDFTTDSKYVEFPFKVKSSAIKILKARSREANLKFVAERMRLLRFSVGEHKRYYISEYQHVELPTPAPAEQTAIAAVLSDMDAELKALEARRDKSRDLKQAMMQELLTGKTRLAPAGAAYA